MRKPTKIETAAAEAIASLAADWTPGRESAAWDAVWGVVMNKGYWDEPSRCVWFAIMSSVTHERRLIPCGMRGEVTREQVRYQMGLAPKPPDEDADARVVEFNRMRNRLAYLEGVASDLRRAAPALASVVNAVVASIGITEVA